MTTDHGSVQSNVIEGKPVEASTGKTREVIDPATEEVLALAPASGAEDVDAAVAAARAALPDWADDTPAGRSAALLALADAVANNAEELTAIDKRNVAKTTAVVADEVPVAVDILRYYAGAARLLNGIAAGEYAKDHTSMLRRDPVGVVGIITPWNYPLLMAVMKIAPALAAGNSVVVKPSELTPLSTLRLAELAAEVLPAGVLNVVAGDGDPVGAALAGHPGVAMVTMTGSPETGRKVATAAAGTLKRVQLELGGNAPVVVFEDADVDAVVETLRFASFWNSGQECSAASRVLASREVYDRLLDALVPMVEDVKVGPPESSDEIEVGPLISAGQRDRLLGLVERAADEGATVAVGGAELDGERGFFVRPTLVADVEQGSELVQTELFGPALTVQRFEDEAEALAMANDSSHGLCGSVWTSDVGRAMRMVKRLEVGTAWVNSHLVFFPEMPWGGLKDSGQGVDMSPYALDEHTQLRHVVVSHA